MREGNRKKLADAIMELTRNRPIDDISVSTLVNRAGVSRSTFYYYFSVPQDVVDYMMDAFLDEYLGILSLPKEKHSLNVPRQHRLQQENRLHSFVVANASYIHYFFQPENYFRFQKTFFDHFVLYCRVYVLVLIKGDGHVEQVKRGVFYDYALRLIFAHYFELLRFWEEREFSENGEDFTAILETLFSGMITLQAK